MDKSASLDRQAFTYWLRTGRLPRPRAADGRELKFNPYRDPDDGRFTFAPGGPRSLRSVVVRKGDTLSGIAKSHGMRTEALAKANNIKHPDHIEAGQTLHVPSRSPDDVDQSSEAAKPSADKTGGDATAFGKIPEGSVIPPASKHIWPVAGEGSPARQGAIGPNGKPYSDGRYDPSGRNRNGRPHYGIDLPASPGAPVRAAASGKLFYSGDIPGYGKTIAILHPDGHVSIYAHLTKLNAAKLGTVIGKGETVGLAGNSGNASTRGTHLHFEVRKYIGAKTLGKVSDGAKPVDPTKWILGK